MKELLTGVGAAVLVGLLLFLAALVAALAGALTGWCVEHSFLSQFVLGGIELLGFRLQPNQLPALGAALGFIGAFFRSSASHKED